MRHETIAAFVRQPSLAGLAGEILGTAAIPFRATLFDKSPNSNWLVVWHQDTALPIQHRRDVPGWGPWSVKDGITYAHAPAAALEKVVALRVHLDDSTVENGPLRVLPRTHNIGVLENDAIRQLASDMSPVDCVVPLGGVIAMKPLIVHASSKSRSEQPRRVLHIEYAPSLALQDGLELAIA
ncbi:MAG: phytanoyl-CoA dioxygenase family protein [Candidatus Acidiferrales bacterium]